MVQQKIEAVEAEGEAEEAVVKEKEAVGAVEGAVEAASNLHVEDEDEGPQGCKGPWGQCCFWWVYQGVGMNLHTHRIEVGDLLEGDFIF